MRRKTHERIVADLRKQLWNARYEEWNQRSRADRLEANSRITRPVKLHFPKPTAAQKTRARVIKKLHAGVECACTQGDHVAARNLIRTLNDYKETPVA